MYQEGQSKSKLEIGGGGSDEEEDEITEDPRLVELRKSICKEDWNAVEQFFKEHPLDTIILSNEGYTTLHFAILAGKYKIAEELIKRMSETDPTDLEKKFSSNGVGHTVLTLVATTGRTHMARCIVEKNSKLLEIKSDQGFIPVTTACAMGHKEMTRYLYSVTPPAVLLPQNGNHGFDLMRFGMENKILDICLDLIKRNPKLTVTTDKEEQGLSPIVTMSRQPDAFLSGCRLQFWQMWIYPWLEVKPPTTSSGEEQIIDMTTTSEKKTSEYEVFTPGVFGRCGRLSLMLQNFFGVKQIYDLKLTYHYSLEILQCMCNHVSTLRVQHLRKCGVVDAMFEAAKHGMVEFVTELWEVTQPLIYTKDGKHVFRIAIQYRQVNIFNLLYDINEEWRAHILNQTDRNENNMLHVAGEMAPPSQLDRFSSIALHMKKEIQWFKEVEKIVPEWHKKSKNRNGKTPYEVFSDSHEKLVKEGEKWMRDTASSFIIVGTLVITIAFAAAITLPGGNAQDGLPNFLQKRSFMIFIISDAISFFSASTSVIMFWGILTSRLPQEDFHESLLRKFFMLVYSVLVSLAAMAVSFSAALWILLQHQLWAIIPIITMASIPVTFVVKLLFPPLLEIASLVTSEGISFNRKMKA